MGRRVIQFDRFTGALRSERPIRIAVSQHDRRRRQRFAGRNDRVQLRLGGFLASGLDLRLAFGCERQSISLDRCGAKSWPETSELGRRRRNIVTVVQAAATSQSGPEISLVSTIAGGAQTTAPNTWLAIYGINLSTTVRPWQSSDFVNGQMPTQLDGVSVTINGKPAFVEYVSSNQVNLLTPLDAGQGNVQITVTSGGVTSAPLWIPMQTVAPGFFQFSGAPYVAATHAAGTLLAPTTLYPGASTPAKPGEVVTIYGSGFGQTTPGVRRVSQLLMTHCQETPLPGAGAIELAQ